jgi:hypothetical protein
MWEARLRSEPAWLPPPPAPSPRHPLVRSLQHLRHLGIHRLPRGGALLLAHGHCTQAEGQRRASAARVAARVGAEGKRFGAEPLRSRQAEGAADPGADALPSFSARSCPSALREEVTLPAGCPSSARSREGEPRAAPSPLLLPSPGPMRSLMPHSATMWRAMRVACRRSLVAPEVTWSSPNTSSSAALPPMHTSMWARSCWRVVEYSSLSGTWLTMPSAWPRGTMVAWGGQSSGGRRTERYKRTALLHVAGQGQLARRTAQGRPLGQQAAAGRWPASPLQAGGRGLPCGLAWRRGCTAPPARVRPHGMQSAAEPPRSV